MFFTILFVVLLFSKKEKNSMHKKINDEIELFEIENPYNQLHNPLYYNEYWNKIKKKLFYFLIKFFVIIGCICLDFFYIQYVYFN